VRVPIPAGTITTRFSAKSSTCTSARGPSRRLQGPRTGPAIRGWKRTPTPIGRASASNDRGIPATWGAREPALQPASAVADAIRASHGVLADAVGLAYMFGVAWFAAASAQNGGEAISLVGQAERDQDQGGATAEAQHRRKSRQKW
jgi:hypothetical protein